MEGIRRKVRECREGIHGSWYSKKEIMYPYGQTNLPEWIYMQCGLGMIGAVLVTVNTNYKSSELEYILKQSDSTTLVLMDGYRDSSFVDMTYEVLPGLSETGCGRYSNDKMPYLKNVVYVGGRNDTPGPCSGSMNYSSWERL